jgi:hypothetical protein
MIAGKPTLFDALEFDPSMAAGEPVARSAEESFSSRILTAPGIDLDHNVAPLTDV